MHVYRVTTALDHTQGHTHPRTHAHTRTRTHTRTPRAHTRTPRAHTLTHTSLVRTPLDEEKQTSVYSAGFEPAIPTSKRPQTNALGRAATGIGTCLLVKYKGDEKS